jgi:hypothetical protein
MKTNEMSEIMNCYSLSLPQSCFKLGMGIQILVTTTMFPSVVCEIFNSAVRVSDYVSGRVFIESRPQICVLPRSMAVLDMEYMCFKTCDQKECTYI